MTKILLTGDVHVTDKVRDGYRWDTLQHLGEVALSHRADFIVIAGDLTDEKNNHSSELVNSVIDRFRAMPVPVLCLKGNHDYIDPKQPFFGFLQEDWARFIIEPEVTQMGDLKVLFLPHTRQPHIDWKAHVDKDVDLVIAHQTFHGASTGIQALVGISSVWFSTNMKHKPAMVLSGDVHPPQKIGDVEYIGAPHPTSFGEDQKYRFVMVESTDDELAISSIWRDPCKKATRRVTLEGAVEEAFEGLAEGDMVKIVVDLDRHDLGYWEDIRQELQAYGDRAGIFVQGVRAKVRDAEIAQTTAVELGEIEEDPEMVLDLYGSGIRMNSAMVDAGIALFHDRL